MKFFHYVAIYSTRKKGWWLAENVIIWVTHFPEVTLIILEMQNNALNFIDFLTRESKQFIHDDNTVSTTLCSIR